MEKSPNPTKNCATQSEMFLSFQNGVKNEYLPKTWLFRPKLRFWPDPTPGFKNALFLVSKISNQHFTVGVSRNRKNLIFDFGIVIGPKSRPDSKKKYLEARGTPGKGRKLDFSNLGFSILPNFPSFSVIFGGFPKYWELQDLGPRLWGCNNLEKIRFGQKWP